MTNRVQRSNSWLVAAACVAAASASVSFTSAARAQAAGAEQAPGAMAANDIDATQSEESRAGGSLAGQGGRDEPLLSEPPKAEPAKRWTVGVEDVMGFGKTDVITQDLPGRLPTKPDTSRSAAQAYTNSFLMYLGYDLGRHVGVSGRLPLSFGTFSQDGRKDRGTSALGALEIEGKYDYRLNDSMRLVPSLALTLPTAQGDELLDPKAAAALGFGADLNSFSRYSVNRSAAASRGSEENALFEPKRIGFTPKVMFEVKNRKLTIQPYLKMANLISTIKSDNSYIGEVVLGAWGGYLIHPMFEPGLRIWTNVRFAGNDTGSVAVLEPQLRMHFGSITPIVGGILPFAGTLTDPQFGGLRLAVAGNF